MIGIVELAGSAILAGATLQVFASTYGVLRRRALDGRRQRLALDLLRQRVEGELALLHQRRKLEELQWEGYRKFRIDRKIMETNDICSFYFMPHDGMPIPEFFPGQYLTFRLNIPGQAQPIIRCYSLSDSPRRGAYYRCTIKRLPPPRDKPDAPPGLASTFFHGLNEGDLVDVRAPSGNFYLDEKSSRPVVLIGGGVGLTPVVSMLNRLCETASRREVWFFYGVRHRGEHAMYDHLQDIANRHSNVRITVCYSDPSETCVEHRDFHVKGWVDVNLMKRMLPSNNYEFFICGPPPMMETITRGLGEWGVPEADIHFEAFGPATVKRQAPVTAPIAPAGAVFKLSFARSGRTVDWSETNGSILDTAEKLGIQMSSGCRAGNCGTCETAVREGAVAYLLDSGFKPKAGSCLPCIAVPQGDVALDA